MKLNSVSFSGDERPRETIQRENPAKEEGRTRDFEIDEGKMKGMLESAGVMTETTPEEMKCRKHVTKGATRDAGDGVRERGTTGEIDARGQGEEDETMTMKTVGEMKDDDDETSVTMKTRGAIEDRDLIMIDSKTGEQMTASVNMRTGTRKRSSNDRELERIAGEKMSAEMWRGGKLETRRKQGGGKVVVKMKRGNRAEGG